MQDMWDRLRFDVDHVWPALPVVAETRLTGCSASPGAPGSPAHVGNMYDALCTALELYPESLGYLTATVNVFARSSRMPPGTVECGQDGD